MIKLDCISVLLLAVLACLGVGAVKPPYTMLACDEANDCNNMCTLKSDTESQLFPCPNPNEKCAASNIKCKSLKYITIDDWINKFGSKKQATEKFKKEQTALFVSVQSELLDGTQSDIDSDSGKTARFEWANILSQAASNEPHWQGSSGKGYHDIGLFTRSPFESKSEGRIHISVGDKDLLAKSLKPEAASNGIYVQSYPSQLLPKRDSAKQGKFLMPDGTVDIGSNVVQMIDPVLADKLTGNFNSGVICEVLEKLKLGLEDNYDHIYVTSWDTGSSYTSTHMIIHQPGVPGTGFQNDYFMQNCGGERNTGVTRLQPLNFQHGPFIHEWLHQYAVYGYSLSPTMAGHWGWVAFDSRPEYLDYRGILGGFNYMYCADGVTRFSMDHTKDPAEECGCEKGGECHINVDEKKSVLIDSSAFPDGRWNRLGDPAGRPDWYHGDQTGFNKMEMYIMGLQTDCELGVTGADCPDESSTLSAGALAAGALAGIVVAVTASLMFFLMWCHYPFMVAEMQKRPHKATHTKIVDKEAIDTEATTVHSSPPNATTVAQAEEGCCSCGAGTDSNSTAQKHQMYTWSEWCTILGASFKSCILWYANAAIGGETAFCKTIRVPATAVAVGTAKPSVPTAGDDSKEKSNTDSDANGGATAVPTADDGFVAKAVEAEGKCAACLSLYARACSACFCECWTESNEEIDHHEERKEGKSWLARLFASLVACLKFYFTSVWEEAVLAEQAAAAELVLLEKAAVEEYHDLEKKHHDKLEADKKAEEARAADVTVKDDAEVHKL